jgi:hypothetical protein
VCHKGQLRMHGLMLAVPFCLADAFLGMCTMQGSCCTNLQEHYACTSWDSRLVSDIVCSWPLDVPKCGICCILRQYIGMCNTAHCARPPGMHMACIICCNASPANSCRAVMCCHSTLATATSVMPSFAFPWSACVPHRGCTFLGGQELTCMPTVEAMLQLAPKALSAATAIYNIMLDQSS